MEYYKIKDFRPIFLNEKEEEAYEIKKEIKQKLLLENQLNTKEIYADENNNLYLVDMSLAPAGVKIVYNPIIKEFQETATLEEQRQYWLNKSLEISRKIEEYKMLGFEGRQELVDLENKLQEYKLKYASTFEGEALAMDKHMNSTKPVK